MEFPTRRAIVKCLHIYNTHARSLGRKGECTEHLDRKSSVNGDSSFAVARSKLD